MDLSRRDAIKAVLGTVALGAVSGSATAQAASTDTQPVREATYLLGDFEGSPNDVAELAPGGPFFKGDDWQKTRYAYIIENVSGVTYAIDHTKDRWEPVSVVLPQYAENDLPANQQGLIAYNSGRDVIAFSDGNDWEYPVVGDDILVSPVTVSNTTTETLLWDAGLSAGSLKVGRVYEVSLFGQFSNASTADMVELHVYLGGALVATISSTGKRASASPWRSKTIFTVRDTGASGEVAPHTLAKFDQEDADDHHGAVAVDTTVPEQIEVYAQWNNAKTGNSLTLGHGYMKEVS